MSTVSMRTIASHILAFIFWILPSVSWANTSVLHIALIDGSAITDQTVESLDTLISSIDPSSDVVTIKVDVQSIFSKGSHQKTVARKLH